MSFSSSPRSYDAVIIGAGQAGVPLARTLAQAGWKTALIESTHVGGTCINEGCTPSKTMIASARVAHLARRGSEYGVQTGDISVDMKKIRQRKRKIVESFRSSTRKSLENTDGVDLFMGSGRFVDRNTIEISPTNNDDETQQIKGDKIFINTGQQPRTPSIRGLDEINPLNSTTIMELDHIPEHLLIIGGGYVGLEFGQMFRRFGSNVTIIQRSDQVLTHEDKDIAEEITEILREEGIQVYLSTEAKKVSHGPDGSIRLTVVNDDGERTIRGTHLLEAAGRVPNVGSLNLQASGVTTNQRGYIQVNDRLETNISGIYALGDVKGGPAFTHISYDDFRIIRENLLKGGERTVNDRPLTYTVFIDPQLGRVGLTESQARKKGLDIKIAKMPMRHVARAIEVNETLGSIKVIIDAETDRILGAAVLGIEGGEVISALEVAMLGKLPYTTLRDAVFPHPTLIESLNNLFTQLDR